MNEEIKKLKFEIDKLRLEIELLKNKKEVYYIPLTRPQFPIPHYHNIG